MSNEALIDGLDQLRDVDRLIDISKSTLQFDIIIALNNKGELPPAEIANAIGQRRKAVTDAMRKLRNKGLVEVVSENGKSATYRLTESGLNCVAVLMNFMGVMGTPPQSANLPQKQVMKEAIIGNITMASVTSELLLSLGTSKGHKMPAKKLAGAMGLSVQRTESYLDVYLNREPKLFKRYIDDPAWAKALAKIGIKVRPNRQESVYSLTNEGLQQYYKLPAYTKLKQSLTYSVLSRITGTTHPKDIVRTIIMVLCASEAAFLVSMLIPLGIAIINFWLVFTMLIGCMALVNLLLYKFSGFL